MTMRGRDEESGEFLGPSRSQKRREALDVLELAKALVALTPAQLSRVPVPEATLPHIEDAKRITSNIAHKRQLAFLAKQMRKLDDDELQAMRDALDEKSDASRAEAAALHRVEAWRVKLVDGGDDALSELLDMHPDADRQRLRQLVRNAQDERKRGKPPRAFRELFRELRTVMLGVSDADSDEFDDGPEDAEDSDV
jgi:ribosome-associated protein